MTAAREWQGAFSGAGIWTGVPTAEYHAGCGTPTPALSNSVAQLLLTESPLHAWAAFNRDKRSGGSRRMEIGSVAHRLALNAGAQIQRIDADSYRTNAAKALRDEALANGMVPCLTDDYDRAQALAVPLRAAAENYLGIPMDELLREVVVVWADPVTGGWRRAMLDCCRRDLTAACDLKSTEASVAPDACARRIYANDTHIQAGWYVGALDAVDPKNAGRRSFGFIFAESNEPFAVSPPLELSEAGYTMARQQIDVACALWDNAVATNNWPGFGTDPVIAEPPSFILSQWQGRYENDESLNPVSDVRRTGWNANHGAE